MANKLAAAGITVHDLDDWANWMSRTHLKDVQHQGGWDRGTKSWCESKDVHYHGMGK